MGETVGGETAVVGVTKRAVALQERGLVLALLGKSG